MQARNENSSNKHEDSLILPRDIHTPAALNFFEYLPFNVILNLLAFLNLAQIMPLLSTNRQLRAIVEDDIFWRSRFGVNNKQELLDNVNNFHPVLKMAILQGYIHFSEGNNIKALLKLNAVERIPLLFSPHEIAEQGELFLSHITDMSFIVLRGKLLTTQQFLSSMGYRFLTNFNYGIQALGDKLIEQTGTLDALIAENIKNLSFLLTKHGIIALREGLITLEQVALFPQDDRLSKLLSEAGLLGLRRKIFTVESVAKLPPGYASFRKQLDELKLAQAATPQLRDVGLFSQSNIQSNGEKTASKPLSKKR